MKRSSLIKYGLTALTASTALLSAVAALQAQDDVVGAALVALTKALGG